MRWDKALSFSMAAAMRRSKRPLLRLPRSVLVRFWSALIETDSHLSQAGRYILLNPVRAGLCATATDWKWSSYRKTMGLTTKGPNLSTMLLCDFGRRLEICRKRFAAFIREAE